MFQIFFLQKIVYKFIEDETINYINHFKKSFKSELFVNYPGLFLNEDIKQYVKNVINEISKKDNNNTDNKKE